MSCSIDLSQTVQISDDENTENTISRNLKSTSDVEDVIIIDDDAQKSENENNNCIIVSSGIVYKKSAINYYDDIFTENRLFAEYIEKLLNLENSEGMLRVVNRNLVKKYKESSLDYRKSEDFESVLVKSLSLLEVDPDHKFSNVKNVCNVLKNNGLRKIAPKLLDKKLKSFRNHKIKRNKQPSGVNKKLRTEVIDLENLPINLDDEPMEVIELDDSQNLEPEVTEIIDSEKENVIENHENIVASPNVTESCVIIAENHENGAKEANSDKNCYLVPLTEVEWIGSSPNKELNKNTIQTNTETISITEEDESEFLQKETKNKIKAIELEIATITVLIEKLEQEEVTNYDSEDSPYIKSDRYKAQIVKLYNQLCELTGSVPVKHHTVRLEVPEGHPTGAVKLLEAFINNNIGSDGMPPFPDLNDVVKCVELANTQDNLNWNRRQIMKEASALFTQCGRALQKLRQKREYRDLLLLTRARGHTALTSGRRKDQGGRRDHWDEWDDPADNDPTLLAKLEENRRVALKKERDLLEKYARMELEATANAVHLAKNHHPECGGNHCDDSRNLDASDASTSQLPSQNNQVTVNDNEKTNVLCRITNIATLATEQNENSEQTKTDCKVKNTETNKGSFVLTEVAVSIEKYQNEKWDTVDTNKTTNTGNNKLGNNNNFNTNTTSTTSKDAKDGQTRADSTEYKNETLNKVTEVVLSIAKDQWEILDTNKTINADNNKHSINNTDYNPKTSNASNDAKDNVTVKQEPNSEIIETQDTVDSSLPQRDSDIKKELGCHQENQDQVDSCQKDCVIKKEPQDDKKRLEFLFSGPCEDCEVTVFDIEDPFLIITISDSSDDED